MLALDVKNKIAPEDNVDLWPIHPPFLSRYQEKDYSPNKHGLYDSDILRGFLADASDGSRYKKTSFAISSSS